MIEVSQRFTPPGALPAADGADATDPALTADVAQPDAWAGNGATGADPQAKFNALFGAPAQMLGVRADKNGAGGGAPATQIASAHPPALKLGSRGPEVRALQHALNTWRANQWPTQKPIAEDGRFTAETKQAVEAFQQANGIQTGSGTTLDLTPNGIADVRVQNRLRLENDPTFARLDSFSKQVARDMVTNAAGDGTRSEPLFTLLADPSFAKLGQQAQYAMLETLSLNPRDPVPGSLSDAALVKEYTKLAARPEFQKLDPRTQATIVDVLSHSALPLAVVPGTDVARQIRTGIDNLTRLVTSPAFASLPPDEQQRVVGVLAKEPSDTRLAGAIGSLLGSPDFERLKPDEKTAVVRQMGNYPDDRSIANMERLLAKDWFVAQDLGDKQRSLKTIAYLSQHNLGDRAVIDNTLDKLLGEDSDIKLRWADLSKGSSKEGDSVTRTFGEADADTNTLTLSSQKIALGNDAVPNNDDGRHLVLHTVAHEVNHLLNTDRPRPASFQHFELEFRAWAVGFKAEHGHYPTNREAMGRVRQLLTEKDGAYADIKRAGGKYHDAMMIFSFVQKLTGRAVTAGNLEDILNSKPDTWINRSRDPAEQAIKQGDRMAPLTDGNLDNS